jgi:4-alpha-glucanotransferase
VITPAVGKTLRELQLPGMRLLQFGNFRDRRSSHLPSNAPDNSVCYTGTHDNPTLLEWYCDYCNIEQRRVIDLYLREQSHEAGFSWRAIDTVFRSRAARAIVPMQDILELGGEARMNYPSRLGYWRWRMSSLNLEQLLHEAAPRLRRLAAAAGRG